MTNEENINNIVSEVVIFGNEVSVNALRYALSLMARQKDQQFEEHLVKKREESIEKMKKHILYSESEEYYHNRVMFCQEIINELFPESVIKTIDKLFRED